MRQLSTGACELSVRAADAIYTIYHRMHGCQGKYGWEFERSHVGELSSHPLDGLLHLLAGGVGVDLGGLN